MSERAVKRTVSRLLRLAKSCANEAEAANARTRANELMQKYRIEVRDADLEVSIPVKLLGLWQKDLLVVITREHSCHIQRRDDNRVVVVGESADAHRAVRIHETVSTRLLSRCSASWKTVELLLIDTGVAIDLEDVSDGLLTILAIEMIAEGRNVAEYFGSDQRQFAVKIRKSAIQSSRVRTAIFDRVLKERNAGQKDRNEKLRALFYYTFLTAAAEAFANAKQVRRDQPKAQTKEKESLGDIFEEELQQVTASAEKLVENMGNDRVARAIDIASRAGVVSCSMVLVELEERLRLMPESTIPPTIEPYDEYSRELDFT